MYLLKARPGAGPLNIGFDKTRIDIAFVGDMESGIEGFHSTAGFFHPSAPFLWRFPFAHQEVPILPHNLLLSPPVLLVPSSFVNPRLWSFPANPKYVLLQKLLLLPKILFHT